MSLSQAQQNRGARTSTVLLAQVGEPPDVTQAHGKAHLGQDVLQLAVPSGPAVLGVGVRRRQQSLYWSGGTGAQAHAHLAALIVHGVLQRQQVGHRLCDRFAAVLMLGHLGVLWHGCGTGSPLVRADSGGGPGGRRSGGEGREEGWSCEEEVKNMSGHIKRYNTQC